MALTDLQNQVLRLLRMDARLTDSQIADRLAVEPAAVTEARCGLETDRTIIAYGAVVNEERIDGSPVRALIEVEVQPQREGGFDTVARRISKFPEVRGVTLLSGSYDLSLEVTGNTLQEVAFFVSEKLATIDGVNATRTHFLLKKYKQAGFALHEDEDYERLKVAP